MKTKEIKAAALKAADATKRRRDTLALAILLEAAKDSDVYGTIQAAIENIEEVHEIDSPKWEACMGLLQGDVTFEFFERIVADNTLFNEWLLKKMEIPPKSVILCGRAENLEDPDADRCWVSWPDDDDGNEPAG
jgi:hypothetical protein